MRKAKLIILVLITCIVNSYSQHIKAQDSLIFESIISKAQAENWNKLPLNEVIIKVGAEFLGTPYIAHTLEINDKESLVLNFRELDCTTFLETCLCMAKTIHSQNPNLNTYQENLVSIRYRDGKLDNYCSRLHYFSDWIYNKQNSGMVDNITTKAGGIPFPINVGFMSTHPEKYKMLKDKADYIKQMSEIEKEINQRQYSYIPKEKLSAAEKNIQSGDIIAITTNMAGLDISHVGYALWQANELHFMHASSGAKKVVITESTLLNYLNGIKHHTGVMIIRPTSNSITH